MQSIIINDFKEVLAYPTAGLYTHQAFWSYNLTIKGFAWSEAKGRSSPSDSELFNAANWTKYSSSPKYTAGLLVRVLL